MLQDGAAAVKANRQLPGLEKRKKRLCDPTPSGKEVLAGKKKGKKSEANRSHFVDFSFCSAFFFILLLFSIMSHIVDFSFYFPILFRSLNILKETKDRKRDFLTLFRSVFQRAEITLSNRIAPNYKPHPKHQNLHVSL